VSAPWCAYIQLARSHTVGELTGPRGCWSARVPVRACRSPRVLVPARAGPRACWSPRVPVPARAGPSAHRPVHTSIPRACWSARMPVLPLTYPCALRSQRMPVRPLPAARTSIHKRRSLRSPVHAAQRSARAGDSARSTSVGPSPRVRAQRSARAGDSARSTSGGPRSHRPACSPAPARRSTRSPVHECGPAHGTPFRERRSVPDIGSRAPVAAHRFRARRFVAAPPWAAVRASGGR
jgi:hypothetical protein